MDPVPLTAVAAAAAIRRGKLTAEEVVAACLERIAEREPVVGAWAFLDRDHAVGQAREADAARRAGRELGPLDGIPVGVKDIFDTADMPTENGTVLHAGRQPTEDAAAVALLRAAGAIVLGKTVTTELAVYWPGKTRNPHDPRRTPGGSSSGSAAAVAAGMVPLALGTQTNGSVIRPAAYCGVVGYKPTYGLISRHGALRQSPPLDQVGVFARSLEDVALLGEALMVYDERDAAMRPRARPRLRDAVAATPPVPPRLAFVRTPMWEQAEPDVRAAFPALVAQLGNRAVEVELPPIFAHAVGWHRTIMEADLAKSFAAEYAAGRDRLSPRLSEMIERGQAYRAVEYNEALEAVPQLHRALAPIFAAYDALVTPATTGAAPIGLESTGSPIFCTIWTLCGVPAVSLPILRGAEAMPLGVQLVAARGDDGRLLRAARWLVEQGPVPSRVR
ncbi:MAG TPA: amidase [Methylomirabilota bacterium]|jgi:Asp-tRNA(Asn)/Glu-tRNA(Gln) amidotransferase A subunit family amidase|nr:amidase [Methylomirabilota bacterium]